MRRHMPHVADRGGRLSAFRRRVEPAAEGICRVGDVNHRVMDRMQRVNAKDGVREIHRVFQVSGLSGLRLGEMPQPPDLEGFRLEIVRIFRDQLVIRRSVRERVEIHLFALRQPGPMFERLGGELSRSRFVPDGGLGHAPIRDAAIRVEACGLAKRALGLPVPETVQLADALLDELLHQRILGGDREMHVSRSPHQVRAAPRSAVERLAKMRVAGEQTVIAAGGERNQHDQEGNRRRGLRHPVCLVSLCAGNQATSILVDGLTTRKQSNHRSTPKHFNCRFRASMLS